MKILPLAAAVFAIFISQSEAGFSELKYAKECKKQYSVDSGTMKSLKNSGVLPNEQDENGRCFAKCVAIKKKVLVDDDINIEGLNGKLDAETFAAVEECNKLDGEGTCEKAYQKVKCAFQYKDKIEPALGN